MLQKPFANITLLSISEGLVKFDASTSSNPNEIDKKKDLLFMWECNVPKDSNCKRSEFTSGNYYVIKYLNG